MTSTGEPRIVHSVRQTEVLAPEPAEALAGVLDIDVPADDMPPLWHWIYLVERRPQRDLGPDGHPAHGIPAPPGPGRLRMFGGGRVTTHRPLRLGRPATKTTRLLREVDKHGASGPMTLTTVRIEIEQDGHVAVTEEQDILYRMAGSTVPPRPGPAPAADEAPPEGRLELAVDPVLLFRFSALTYNAHRIHYDAEYAEREGYPGLVVHGPLQALLMGECFHRSGRSLVGSTFSYRLVAPTFGQQRIEVTTHVTAGQPSAVVRDGHGRTTATATLQQGPAQA